MEQRLYFAYGSNINLEQMAQRCPNAVPVMPVVLRGHALAFRGHGGVATVLPKAGSSVPGLLWDLTPECERALDRYEGYPSLYGKHSMVVADTKTNTGYRVMVYVMTPKNAEIAADPSRWYFSGILQGYKQNGLDPRPLFEALRATREEIARQEVQAPKGFRQYRFDWRAGRSMGRNGGDKPKGRGR